MQTDTIAAVATPPGVGGIAILRISGPDAEAILRQLTGRAKWESHRLTHAFLRRDGEMLDEIMAVLMRAPKSYTREDVAELHCHGGDIVCRQALEAVLRLGARPAEPGEFTRRAYENGRIDLAQAEATMRLIGATGEAAARQALRQMRGAVSRGVQQARDALLEMLSEIAAAVDFPDEIEEIPTAARLAEQARALSARLLASIDPRQGRALDQGYAVVIAGRPNVGKSSLLNRLLGEERAIVTAQAGTTRDMVEGTLRLGGVAVTLTDTAGLRDAEGEAERIGVERARRAMEGADLLLIVLDAASDLTGEEAALLSDTAGRDRLILLNKSDLPQRLSIPHDLAVSAETGEGIDALRGILAERAAATLPGDALLTQARHIDAARRAAALLCEMADGLQSGMPLDFAAIDAREALAALSEITGEGVEEAVVDQVFRRFCVGK